jgi:hypothetical protein
VNAINRAVGEPLGRSDGDTVGTGEGRADTLGWGDGFLVGDVVGEPVSTGEGTGVG